MTVKRRIVRLMPLVTTLMFGACAMTMAQPRPGYDPRYPDRGRDYPSYDRARPLFEWSGRVDREVQLSMRGRDISMFGDRIVSRPRVEMVLPREEGFVFVRTVDGRGDVDVVQQPTARNGYTAIVRMRDPRAGIDNYRIEAFWEPAYVDYGPGRGGPGRGNGPPGGYGRGGGIDGPGSLHWSGNVDDIVELRIHGTRADYVTLRGLPTTNVRAQFIGDPLDRRDGSANIRMYQGRGAVSIVEQPSARNNYTAVVRITDPRTGYGFYDFTVNW